MRTRFLLLTVLVLLLSFSLASADYDDAILYYSFDNADLSGSNPLDLSSSGFDGTNNGSTTGATGILGEAFSFDGSNDYVYKSDETSLDLTGGYYTISYWFKADPSISFGTNRRHVVKDNGAAVGWGGNLWSQTSYLYTHQTDGNYVPTISSRNTSQWYHVVMRYNDSDNLRYLYIDGVLIGSDATTVNVTASTSYLCIGTYCTGGTSNAGGQYWYGEIDELAIYDYDIGATGVAALWNDGAGFNPYDTATFTHNVTGLYLSPNSTVYTDETDLRGYVTLNTTTSVYGINYTYYVNGSGVVTGQYTGSPSGTQYTLPVLTNTYFSQDNNVYFTAFAVNSTGSAISEERTSGVVTIDNRVPTSALSWTTESPLNNTNFSGIVTPGDGDQDSLNISYSVYKNGGLYLNGTDNNNAYPYGSITLFTIDSATTNINDTFTFNVSIFDGYEYHISSDSNNATVTSTENFTITVNDEWSGTGLTNATVFIVATGNNTVLNPYYTDINGVSNVFKYYLPDGLNYTVTGDYLGSNSQSNNTLTVICTPRTPTPVCLNPTVTVIDAYADQVNVTLITPIISNETSNVTVFSDDYLPRSYSSWNLSENLAAKLHQSEYSFNTYEYLSSDLLSGVTYTISGYSYDQFNLSEGSYTVTSSKSGYYDLDYSFNATALTVTTLDITGMFNAIINFSVTDALSGSPINFSGYAYNIAEDTYTNFSDVEQYYTVNAIDGTYQFYLYADDYVINATNTFNDAITSGVNLVELALYPAKTVIFNFYDELDGNLLNNITIDLVLAGTSSGYNGSTSNGSYMFDGLATDDYSLEYSSTNYTTRYYPFTLTTNDFYNITLYMVSNSSGTSPITIEVIDEQYSDVPGAVVKALKYDVASGNYIQVTSGSTDDQGEVILDLFKNDGFYKFVVVYNGVTVKTTSPSTIVNDNILIPISISTDLFTDFFTYLNYEYSLDFNNATNNFRFTYNDVTNAISTQACLKVYKVLSTGLESEINSSCDTSSAATLLAGITPVNGTTYIARAYYDSELIATLVQEYVETPNLGFNGWFLQLLILMAFSVAAVFSIELLPISAAASLIVGRALGLNVIAWSVIAGLMVIAIIVSFIINRNKG